ncbi:DUF1642 domain-containing protein [Jeotgalibaca porci]|uniref:DUF1642 domain-containing protein n=1 Tax=Jeotgalibaca porci TaxID=1868793 RepID=UPI00359F6CFA
MNKKEFIERLINMRGCGAKWTSWERGWDDAISDVIRIAEELDEPELTQRQVDKWLGDRGMVAVDTMMVHQTGMQNKVVVEKPVIPKFIANWIESYRKKTLAELINDVVYSSDEDSQCFRRWFHEEMGFESNYSEFLSRSWLDGYEVEKEKVYIIKFAPSIYGTPTYGAIGTQSGKKIMQSIYGSPGVVVTPNQYTEEEIKEVGSKYMSFAEEVVE